jgi:hypothetical protein
MIEGFLPRCFREMYEGADLAAEKGLQTADEIADDAA